MSVSFSIVFCSNRIKCADYAFLQLKDWYQIKTITTDKIEKEEEKGKTDCYRCDDTLVPEAGSVINPEYYDIIRECRKRGIIFGVASGRQKPCVRKLFEPVLDEIFILADNGYRYLEQSISDIDEITI